MPDPRDPWWLDDLLQENDGYYKAMLRLYVYERWNKSQISRRLGISWSAVDARLKRMNADMFRGAGS